MSTDTNPDVEAIFDLAADNTGTETANADTETSTGTDETAETTENAESGAESPDLYPYVLRTYKVGDPDLTEGQNPPGTLTVTEFAGHLSIENFQIATAKGETVTPDAMVQAANVYTGIKAKRHTLPVVLVFPADVEPISANQKDAKVYLPVAEATETYRNRPERGSGTAATSKRSYDELLSDAAKKLNSLNAIIVRYDRVADQKNKAVALLAKYAGWLRSYHKDAENPDETVNQLIAQKAAELEEAAALEADAAKNADISDAAPVAA